MFTKMRGTCLVMALAMMPALADAAPVLFSTSGATAADIQATVDAFRAALGNPNNGNAPGPLAGGRREINWDGGGATTTASTGTPLNAFLNTRGAQFTTPGTGFVQAPTIGTDGGLQTFFANATYDATFDAFSAQRLFTPVGSNITDATFFLPGSNGATAAGVSGFGAIFSDVDLANTTRLDFFGLDNSLLHSAFVTPFVAAGASPKNSFSFLGVRFNAGELIGRVRITTGSGALGANDSSTNDMVVMDDFIYAEPNVPVPEPATLSLVALGLAAARIARRRR
jgi:hypothetical protein